ncbi:MAG: helix-turn-helix domain-containing protein [Burkholderiales bacterium]|jgi:hypothetical protein|nr:helix-turn-helix domain-containing protein [Burkholderiales bacterium]
MNKRLQKDSILKHLSKKRTITFLEAWNLYGVVNLSAVIHDLRRDGHEIKRERSLLADSRGNDHFVARYRLA